MISEGSCDTRNLINDYWQFSCAFQGINCFKIYIEIEKKLFKIIILFLFYSIFDCINIFIWNILRDLKK